MDKNSRPKVLYLVHRFPYPPDKGDRIRAFHVLRYLSRQADVHLACLADEPVEPKFQEALAAYCKRLAVFRIDGWKRWRRALGSLVWGGTATEGAFSCPQLRRTLQSWVKESRFDAVLASSSSMVPYLELPDLQAIPAVVDLVDVDSQKWFDYAVVSGKPKAWFYRLEGRRLRRLEQNLPACVRAVTLVSQAEVDLYRKFCAPGTVCAVSNGVDLDYFQPQPRESEEGCVFVGALDYRPNVDGAAWFCKEVWPEVHRRFPQARLQLVGRQPAPEVRRLAEVPGVDVVGQVPDVRPYVAAAAVAVVPLRLARGVQNKVLEALAMAKVVVASPQALAGLRHPETSVCMASSPGQWVKTLDFLLKEKTLRQKYGAAGRNFVEEHHHWDRCLEPLGPLLGITSDHVFAGDFWNSAPELRSKLAA